MLGVFPDTALIESLLKALENQNKADYGSQIFTTSQTWTAPANLRKPIHVLAIGGGGGGGGGYSSTYTGGGGGSGAVQYAVAMVKPGDELEINIGAGGSAGTGGASPTGGGNGGASQVIYPNHSASIVYANGGGGGGAASSSANGTNGNGGQPAAVDNCVISSFGINGTNGQNSQNWAGAPVLPLGAAVSTSNIVTLLYNNTAPTNTPPWYTGVGGPGGGVNANGTEGGNGFVIIWWGD